MRSNMDPMGPTTSTLAPAIAHIAETASSLSISLRNTASPVEEKTPAGPVLDEEEQKKVELHRKQVLTVRWVLDAPHRIRTLIRQGKRKEAEEDWAEIVALLNKWTGVKGVEEVRKAGEAALKA